MGNHSYFPLQALVFVQHLQDRCFGEIDVFRTQDARFVMKVIRSHIVGDMKHTVFKQILEWLKTNSNQFIVPLMHIQNKVEKGFCIEYEVSEVYTEYYNFTLLDLLRSKKGLEQSQLWFIFQVMLSITTTLRKMKLGINISVDKVFLTLKGFPCVYFHHFVSLEDSFTYSQFAMGQRVAIIMLQLCLGEEIRNIEDLQQHDFLIYLGKACSKYKMMGRLIKELLNRENTEEEILETINLSIEKGEINAYTEIKLAKFRYALPNQNSSSSIKKSESQSTVNQTANKTVDFKPKKHSINKKMSASFKQQEFKQSQTQKLSTQPSHEFPLNAMNKQSTTMILDSLNKKKQECRLKMEQILRKKQLMNHPQKQNFTLQNQMKIQNDFSKPRQKKVPEHGKGYKQR